MNWNRIAATGASVVVIVAVIAGLYFTGSPMEQRILKLDRQRVEDLLTLSRAMSARWERTRQLPTALSVLVNSQRIKSLPVDPESGKPYTYEVVDAHAYRLCADFSGNSEAHDSGNFWEHNAGLECFLIKVESATSGEPT